MSAGDELLRRARAGADGALAELIEACRPTVRGFLARRVGARMERFFMNYGANQGATPGRLLAAVCRRGQVTGADIGSIAIHPNASTFDVAADVAERFADLAGRRDPRDPRTLIRRDRGPVRPRR